MRWVAVPLFAVGSLVASTPSRLAAQGGTPPPVSTAPPTAPLLTRVDGVVFDSVTNGPLPGALVQLVSINDPARIRVALSDSAGTFVLDSVPLGGYLMGFLHERLDALGIEGPLLRLDVRDAVPLHTSVAIPSARTIVAMRCGPDTTGQELGAFIGVVRSARGTPLSGSARVRAQWSELLVGAEGAVQRQNPAHYTNSTATGEFVVCGIPTGLTITARAFVGVDSSGFVELRMPPDGLLVRDVFVGSVATARGTGRLRGVVTSASGQPLSGANVTVWGSERQATTGLNGQFTMQGLPTGTFTVEARALGFVRGRTATDVLDNAEADVSLVLDQSVAMVDTMRVKANRDAAFPLTEFERRRRSGFGYFIDESQLENKRLQYMADIFRSTPGINIMPGPSMGDRVLMRSAGSGGSCVPSIFLNGLLIMTPDGNLDGVLNPKDVRAVEIYSRVASVPIQFQTRSGCGSIVIWTGSRKSP